MQRHNVLSAPQGRHHWKWHQFQPGLIMHGFSPCIESTSIHSDDVLCIYDEYKKCIPTKFQPARALNTIHEEPACPRQNFSGHDSGTRCTRLNQRKRHCIRVCGVVYQIMNHSGHTGHSDRQKRLAPRCPRVPTCHSALHIRNTL